MNEKNKGKMKFYVLVLIFVVFVGVKTQNVFNVLSQFVSFTSEPTKPAVKLESDNNLLPKILNPMHWIPRMSNTPYNPDSELSTVSNLFFELSELK